MCREMQIGIAAAQLALFDCKLPLGSVNLDRVGCVYGSDYMLTMPQEFTGGMRNCLDERGKFDFRNWAEKGLPAVEPLWLLKYLPNMPSCHASITLDFSSGLIGDFAFERQQMRGALERFRIRTLQILLK
jgi:3-oxoacyl-[acyl-carrier-protein] synthase II